MKSIVEQMVDAGYRQHSPSPHNHAKEFYQKRITDEFGTCYFINCYVYNYGTYDPTLKEDRYTFEVQFDSHGDGTFDVHKGGWFAENQWGHPVQTLAKMESFFALIWEATGRCYYERYGED